MSAIVHTNIPDRIAVKGRVEYSIVLEEIPERSIAYRKQIDSKVRGWPLVMAEITVDDVMTSVTLSAPVRNERRAPISVLTAWYPPGTREGSVGDRMCAVDFTKNVLEAQWIADSGIVMEVRPLSEGVALYIEVKRTEDVVLVNVRQRSSIILFKELHKFPPFLELKWPPGDMPQVQLFPGMFPTGEQSGLVVFARYLAYHVAAERQPARNIFIGYAGQDQWLEHILIPVIITHSQNVSRDPSGGGDDPLAASLSG